MYWEISVRARPASVQKVREKKGSTASRACIARVNNWSILMWLKHTYMHFVGHEEAPDLLQDLVHLYISSPLTVEHRMADPSVLISELGLARKKKVVEISYLANIGMQDWRDKPN